MNEVARDVPRKAHFSFRTAVILLNTRYVVNRRCNSEKTFGKLPMIVDAVDSLTVLKVDTQAW